MNRQRKTYKLTPKQVEAAYALAANSTVLLEGGSRSGKTFLALRAICKRAITQPSNHLIARFRFNHAKQSICYQTMPEVIESIGMTGKIRLNKTDWFYEFPNGSTAWIAGLDDKERTEKILGNEYATIFENEASQLSFDSHETLTTRLNPPQGMRGLNIIDYNPPSIHHWGYSIFHKRVFPDGRPVPDDDYARVLMNPADNPNLSPDYLDRLKNLSAAKRRRFLEGDYTLDGGSLWKREWITYGELTDYDRVVVSVDPAGSANGDEIGIVVVGRHGESYCVIDDVSMHGTPDQWAAAVERAYKKYSADAVVAERNYGGDMVEHVIRSRTRNARVKMVTATRGKAVRAEPVSALYERGQVKHAQVFDQMEDEMCMFEPGQSASPNRMDALVWAVTDLMSRGGAASVANIPGL